MIRNIRTATIGLIAAFAVMTANALSPIDFQGAQVLGRGQCNREGKVHMCFFVVKDSKAYIIVWDKEGEKEIFQVDTIKPDYKEEELHSVWRREGQGRRKDEI